MNRWINSFQNHPFQAPWKDIIDLSDKIILQDETVTTDVQELARLKKVITYIGQLIDAADQELVPQSIWGAFQDQSAQCLDQINQYNSNKNIGHLNNANNNLDNLLTYVRPYVVSEKAAAQAAAKAFKAYSDTVNAQIDLIQSKTQTSVNDIQTNKQRSGEILEEIEKSKQNIQQVEQKLLIGDASEKSLQDKMQTLFGEAQEWNRIIGEFHKRLTSGNEQEGAISLQIDDAKNKALKDKGAIEESLQASDNMLKGLKVFYERVFGKEGGDVPAVGLKQELDDRINDLEAFRLEQKKAYEALLGEINSLLPGATSAGLSTAYRELKDSFDAPICQYTRIFYAALAALVVVGFLTALSKIGVWPVEFLDVADPAKVIASLLYKLPMLLPILWLAVFASKRRSESQRLQQEYAHKEALASSYISFKKQIVELGDKQDDLTNKLVDAAIEAIKANASVTLDGKHGDKIPLQELLEKILEKLPEKLPDFSKISGDKK